MQNHHQTPTGAAKQVLEQRVSVITLGVKDLKRSVDFYENVIGWNATPSPPEIAFFDLGGIVFALYPHNDLAKDMAANPTDDDQTSHYQGFTLAHNARTKEDVDRIFSRLSERGAKIIKEPEVVFWGGYSGYFADPDGHAWEVAYNPHWPITKDGHVSMTKD